MKIERVEHYLAIYKGKGFFPFLIWSQRPNQGYLSFSLLCSWLPKVLLLLPLSFFVTKSDWSNIFLVFPLSVQIKILLHKLLHYLQPYQSTPNWNQNPPTNPNLSKSLHVHKLPFRCGRFLFLFPLSRSETGSVFY